MRGVEHTDITTPCATQLVGWSPRFCSVQPCTEGMPGAFSSKLRETARGCTDSRCARRKRLGNGVDRSQPFEGGLSVGSERVPVLIIEIQACSMFSRVRQAVLCATLVNPPPPTAPAVYQHVSWLTQVVFPWVGGVTIDDVCRRHLVSPLLPTRACVALAFSDAPLALGVWRRRFVCTDKLLLLRARSD